MSEVFALIAREDRVHTQVWCEGEILLWDNRTVMHRSDGVLGGDSRSVSFRIGIYDGQPFYVEQGPEPGLNGG